MSPTCTPVSAHTNGPAPCLGAWLLLAAFSTVCWHDSTKESRQLSEVKVVTVRTSEEEHEALQVFAFHSGVSINDVMLRGMRTLLAKEGRTEEFEALLRKSKGRFRSTVDKLEDRET